MRVSRCVVAVGACLWIAACGGGDGGQDATGDDVAGVEADTPPVSDDGVGPDADAAVPDGKDATPTDVAEPDDAAPPDEAVTDEGDDPDADVPPPDGEDPGPDAPDAEFPPDDAETCVGPECLPPCPDDGLSCTEAHRDEGGECVTTIVADACLVDGVCYLALEPDPENACRSCDPAIDPATFTASPGLPCDDGDPCTMGDACGADGACVPGAPNPCEDGNPCTTDSCDKATGCQHANNTLKCDDGNACTVNDHCVGGACVSTTIQCKTDNNPCTDDVCVPADGSCVYKNNTLACDDLDACTENDTCTDGACVGTPLDCTDDDPCTKDTCVHGALGGCSHPWQYGACDDGNACTIDDVCDGDHVCKGSQLACDDGNACTANNCDVETGCVNTPIAGPCDDGDPCTDNDQCIGGECHGTPKDCRDTNWCTVDWCDKQQGCLHGTTTGACDDGNACTVGETCSTGTCEGGLPLNCDDGSVCTTDDCDPKTGCVYVPIEGECDDGDSCTLYDHCVAGKCQGTPKNCDDNDPCTLDSCTALGTCEHKTHTGACVSKNKCLADGHCVSGLCIGTPIGCDDGNPCTLDECDPATGCYHLAKLGTCDDGSICTTDDRCMSGQCGGTPISCEDNDPCTENKCDPLGGCWYDIGFSGPCNDADPCTTNDQCSEGECLGTSVFADPVSKGAKVAWGLSGNPGQGLNVDGNELTCSPAGKCSAGIDNSMSALAPLFNPELTKATNFGQLALLLEHRPPGPLGGTYALNLYWGKGLPGLCDYVAGSCNYKVFPESVTGGCSPAWSYGNASVAETHLTAGGPTSEAPFYIVFGTLRIPLVMKRARLDAQVSFTDGVITAGSGILAGAIGRQVMVDAFNAIPAAQYPAPYTKDKVMGWLDKSLVADLDLDGNGTKESVSLGLTFTLTTGHIVGIQ